LPILEHMGTVTVLSDVVYGGNRIDYNSVKGVKLLISSLGKREFMFQECESLLGEREKKKEKKDRDRDRKRELFSTGCAIQNNENLEYYSTMDSGS